MKYFDGNKKIIFFYWIRIKNTFHFLDTGKKTKRGRLLIHFLLFCINIKGDK